MQLKYNVPIYISDECVDRLISKLEFINKNPEVTVIATVTKEPIFKRTLNITFSQDEGVSHEDVMCLGVLMGQTFALDQE